MAADAAAILARLGAPAGPRPAAPTVRSIVQSPRPWWRAQIESIRRAIAAGRCDKVVAARRCVVALSAAIDETAVMTRLGARYPACVRYAFRWGGACFVGATPERLIARRGAHIRTEALAGSIDPGASSPRGDARAMLRASDKDLAEHAFVVRAIVDQLAPLCVDLDVPAEPEICALPNVLHLRTPLSGTLRGSPHILDLVDVLHPTPAVGGVPTAHAVQWITGHEDAPRGWYTGPVGWFDARGDGELAVALRAGLLAGDHAYVYAGAGIVAESDADAEYAETSLKQRALLDALGVTGG